MTTQQIEEKFSKRPHTPLFARLADQYRKVGRIQEARELLLTGLQRYPSYTTAQIVLAKCYADEKRFSDALEILQRIRTSNPNADKIKLFVEQCENELSKVVQPTQAAVDAPREVSVKEELPSHETLQKETVLQESFTSEEAVTVEETPVQVVTEPVSQEELQEAQPTIEPVVVKEEPLPTDVKREEEISSQPQVREQFGVEPFVSEKPAEAGMIESPIASEDSAEQPFASVQEERSVQVVTEPQLLVEQEEQLSEPQPAADIDDGRIVSRTLAEIYVQQGAYREALITYQLLKRQKPHLTAECDKRIAEIETMVQAKSGEEG